MNDESASQDQYLSDHHCEYFTINQFNSESCPPTENDNRSVHNLTFDKYFSLIHINARSLNKNFESIETLFHSLHYFAFSVIGISETWLHSTSPNMFNIQNYNMIRADRRYGRGGGVAIYIHTHLRYKPRPDLSIDGVESLFIEIINEKIKNTIIGVIYRPPNNEIDLFLDNIELFSNTIMHENKSMFLMGDYNIDLLNTAQHTSSRFLNVLSSSTLYPHIDKPTRICNTTLSETLIDNIFSNIIDRKCNNGILYSDISDHLPIFAIYEQIENVQLKHKSYELRRKESQENINSLISDLSREQWQGVFSANDANLSYEVFLHKFIHYYNKHIPLIQNNRVKIKQPWITKGLMRSILNRNRLYKISLRKPTPHNKAKYKTYRNTLTMLIRTSRKQYYSDKLVSNKDNKNSLWQTINDLIKNKKKEIPNIITNNDQDIDDPDEIANCFNNFFY